MMNKKNSDFKSDITKVSKKVNLKLVQANAKQLFICSPESEKIRVLLTANLISYWVTKQEKVLLIETSDNHTYTETFGFAKEPNSLLYRSKTNRLFMVKVDKVNFERSVEDILNSNEDFDKVIVDISSDLDAYNLEVLIAKATNILLVAKQGGNKRKMRALLKIIGDCRKIIGYVTIR
ncbi:hypothetical protein N5A89_05335 [Lactiplantibacillus pentosus]|nr:hypothetical protein [Lactiplantibacillus pentosus]MBU7502650.1 hypothetical protein [Lactiplantibacillus pentosus]MDY1545783.1 hypothetical protein [Lactiplantibacillus pentosus]UXI98371.1 hypothetical protein N5A89_05335 [Lactiplantibacillus pentosus]